MKKRNKKGLTLIELLGVIVILAVIAVITTPIIFSMVNQSKKKAFQASAQALADAAGNYVFEEEAAGREVNWKTNSITNEHYISFDLSNEAEASKLNVKGKVPKKGRVEITSKGQTLVVAIEDNWCAKKNYDEPSVSLLSLSSDDLCLLAENTSGLDSNEANDIISTVSTLLTRVETLEEENTTLKAKVQNLETNGVGSTAALDKIYPVGSIFISTNLDTPAKVTTQLGGTWVRYASGRALRGTDSDAGTEDGAATVSLAVSNLPSHTHTVGAHSHGLNSHTHTYDKSATATGAASGNTGSTTLTVNQIPSHTHVQNIGTHNAVVGGGSYRTNTNVSGEYVPATTVTTAYQQITGATGGGQGHTHSLNSHTHSITTSSTTTGAASGSTANSTAFNSGSTGSGTAFSVLDPYITVYMYKRTA